MRQHLAVGLLAMLLLCAPLYSAEIHDASSDGNLEQVKRILTANPGLVNFANDRNSTPLHFACEKGHTELAQYLIDKVANLRARDVDGDTPLHCAALANDTVIIRILLEKGIEADIKNNNDQTPLHYATFRGSIDAVGVLLENGADINAGDYEGHTTLHAVSYRPNKDILLLLLSKGADTEAKNNYGRTPLLIVARESGDAETAAILIEHGANINATDRSGATPLKLAVWRGYRGVVDVLLDNNAAIPDVAEIDAESLSDVVKRGLDRLFTILAERGIDLDVNNDKGGSLLHSACEGGSTAIIEILLDRNLDINRQDRYGWTPIHCAAEKGRLDAARLMIESGAAINTRTLAGDTPYNIAIEFDHDELAALLIEAGSEIIDPKFPELKGKYYSQAPPSSQPVLFAPDIVSSNRFEHGTVAFSPDGTEAFWSSSYPAPNSGYTISCIHCSKIENGKWQPPHIAPFSRKEYGDDVPQFSHDGQRLYFVSGRAVSPGRRPGTERIWYIDRTGNGWSEPKVIEGGPNDKGIHWQFSVAASGNIYFSSSDPGGFGMGDLYVSRFVNGKYLTAENLGKNINSEHGEGSPYIAPDESYLMFTGFGQTASTGGADIYISFLNAEGQWLPPQNLGEPVNTVSNEICPIVSFDGKYLFFNSYKNGNADNYWIDAAFIENLRP